MKLQTLGTGQGFLKAGFLGFQKSGKTFTATLLALAVRDLFKLDGPLAMFDTETGSEYVAPVVKMMTGKDLVGLRSRSFDELLEMARECESSGVSVLIADSMTHVWRELCDAYLANINEHRRLKKQAPRTKLEFQDWGRVKGRWSAWTDFYLNSRLHVIVAGRAGFDYDYEEDEDGKKELRKTGIKMKTEGEFGFEPSLLVELEREQELDPKKPTVITRRATVIGDRFSVIDGRTTTFQSINVEKQAEVAGALKRVATFFAPHLDRLTPGAHAPVGGGKSELGVDEAGDDEWHRERRERTILAEEIQGELLRMYPGQTAKEKAAKADLLETGFGTRSWTKITERTSSADLRAGLAVIRQRMALLSPSPPSPGSPSSADDGPVDEVNF